MPSIEHEAPLIVLRAAPEAVTELLRGAFGVELPRFTRLEAGASDVTKIRPADRRADLVIIARDDAGSPVFGVVVEVQRDRDPKKHFSWPEYLSGLHAEIERATWLLVLCTDPQTAAWARAPIPTLPGLHFAPLVVGPDDFSAITAPATPEIAVLSALFHSDTVDTAMAALDAIAPLDRDLRWRYLEVMLACIAPEVIDQIEELMHSRSKNYEFKSEFARHHFALGREEGRHLTLRDAILTVLTARGMVLTDTLQTRLADEQDITVLETWLRRAATTADVAAVFAPQ